MADKMEFFRPFMGIALLLALSPFSPGFSHGQGTAQGDEEQMLKWRAPPEAANRPNPIHADEDSIERGQNFYRQYCVTCHGKSGKGDGPFAERLITEPPDLTTVSQHDSDGELAWKIAKGKNPMPSWSNILEEKQIWDTVNYIRSISTSSN